MSSRVGRTKRRDGRWRDRRNSLPARRRRRRSHRRDTPRGGEYSPVEVESNSARRGVSLRLYSAIGSLAITLICAAAVVFGGPGSFAVVAGFSVGFIAFNAGIALLLAARREESLHMLANDEPAGLLTTDSSLGDSKSSPDGTDGSL